MGKHRKQHWLQIKKLKYLVRADIVNLFRQLAKADYFGKSGTLSYGRETLAYFQKLSMSKLQPKLPMVSSSTHTS